MFKALRDAVEFCYLKNISVQSILSRISFSRPPRLVKLSGVSSLLFSVQSPRCFLCISAVAVLELSQHRLWTLGMVSSLLLPTLRLVSGRGNRRPGLFIPVRKLDGWI